MTANRATSETPCLACGMLVNPTEYHPACACVLFRSVRDAEVVRQNLMAVMKWWEDNRHRFDSVEQGVLYALAKPAKRKTAKRSRGGGRCRRSR